MKFFKSKAGIVTHPIVLFLVGVGLGVLATILWANGTINVAFPFCK